MRSSLFSLLYSPGKDRFEVEHIPPAARQGLKTRRPWAARARLSANLLRELIDQPDGQPDDIPVITLDRFNE